MPAVHEDLSATVFPSEQELPLDVYPRQVTLRDRVTIATLIPLSPEDEVPRALLLYLSDQLNKEIEKGDTYAMIDPIPFSQFDAYWFSNFGAIMLLGDIKSVQEMEAMDRAGANWSKLCLGSFNVRPNYPGRSSHVCNGMFLVTDAARNRGVGRLMGEGYLEWAPKLVSFPAAAAAGGVASLTVKSRATPMRSSIWCTRATWPRVASGMPWASSGSARSPAVVACSPIRVSMSTPSFTDATSVRRARTPSPRTASTRSGIT